MKKKTGEKVCDKIQHSFLIKILKITGIEETYLHIIKKIFSKPTSSIEMERTNKMLEEINKSLKENNNKKNNQAGQGNSSRLKD